MLYDFVGIGFGPSNIALAVSMEEHGFDGNAIFLEQCPGPTWHESMLLEGSDVQHSPFRDFITPVNPRSKYTFLNYLHESGKLFHFLNLGVIHPLRRDYFDYVQWVGRQVGPVRYNSRVVGLEHVSIDDGIAWKVTLDDGKTYLARKIVLATGRVRNIPNIPGLREDPRCIHLTEYLKHIKHLDKDATVAVLGSSQSAVEIILDLLGQGFQNVVSIHRSFSYRLKDTSPFSDEVYFEEYIDYYHALPPEKRMLLDNQTRQTNYSCADKDVIDQLYLMLYEDRVRGEERLQIYRNHAIQSVNDEHLEISDIYTDRASRVPFKLLILATGFLDIGRGGMEAMPPSIKGIADKLQYHDDHLDVRRNYSVCYRNGFEGPELYLNGLCESSHGLGDAGSFSLVSLRARDILAGLTGRHFKPAKST